MQEISVFSTAFRPLLGLSMPPVQWIHRGHGIKPSPSSDRVMNEWSYTSCPPTKMKSTNFETGDMIMCCLLRAVAHLRVAILDKESWNGDWQGEN
jgi:hypothetical protein